MEVWLIGANVSLLCLCSSGGLLVHSLQVESRLFASPEKQNQTHSMIKCHKTVLNKTGANKANLFTSVF